MAGIEITKISLVTYAGEEVSTVNAADPITKYDLRIYYTSTVSGYGVVTVKIGKIVENLGVGTIQPASTRYWEFPMTYFTHSSSATIADLLSMAGLSNQLVIDAYASVDSNTSNTASVTISVTGAPPSGPPIQVTKIALVTSDGAEVSTVSPTDYISRYTLRVYYTLSVYSGIMVVVNVGSITRYIGPYDVQLGSGYVEIPLTLIAQSGNTIADLLSMANLSNQLVFNVYANAGGYSSNTVSVTVQVVTQPPPVPSVSVTRVAVWDSVANKEVTSVNTTDSLAKYSLTVYYISSGNGVCTLTVTIVGKTAWSGSANIQAGSGYWGVPFTWLASGTIADLMTKYGLSGNQITICADISNIRSA
jgi:hypothetical protein